MNQNRPLYIQPIIPYDLLQADLTWREKFVYTFISSLALNSYQRHCDATNAYIAHELGIDERDLRKAITKLKDLGFIEIVYNDKNNQRFITIPEVHRAKKYREEIKEKKRQKEEPRPAPVKEEKKEQSKKAEKKEIPEIVKKYVAELTKDWNIKGIRENKKQELYKKWLEQDPSFLAALEDWKLEKEAEEEEMRKYKTLQDLKQRYVNKSFEYNGKKLVISDFQYLEDQDAFMMITLGDLPGIKTDDPEKFVKLLEENA